MLLNRVTGGDWPGTIAVRRSALAATGGYDGRALVENLELVRTVVAAGGREVLLDDLFVARRPPTSRHFWSQRVRQAYDELARPGRLAWQLGLLPAMAVCVATGRWRTLAPMPIGKHGITGTTDGQVMYIAGGNPECGLSYSSRLVTFTLP